MIESFRVASGDYALSGILVLPDAAGKFPCVVLSHGLVSSKESSKYVYLAERLCASGIAACRFDYHGCGESGGSIAETTLTIRILNLESILNHITGHTSVDGTRMAILGSSFGGSTALVEAARNPRIRCVALWATPHMLDEKQDDTISGIEFKPEIYHDFLAYDLLSEARKVSRALVVHGEQDEVVPWSEGKAIYDNLQAPKKFELIEGGDHTFTNDSHRERAVNLSLEWFRQYL
jgi:uncharacterized protein